MLLAPGQLFQPGNAHWVERDNRGGPEAAELLKIYSVVKKGMTYAGDAAVWDVSNTVQNESKRHGLDPFLVLAIIKVESGFQHGAAAEDGARGLMQIQPESARSIARERRSVYRADKHVDADDPDLDNPIVNIQLGVFYLHSLRRDFSDLTLALAAYNRGPTRVKNLLLEETDVPLEYATRVLSTYQDYRRNARRFD
ncbi:MAG: lytic transglycosylase domain-containing protein [Candidatus Binatia bacterium]